MTHQGPNTANNPSVKLDDQGRVVYGEEGNMYASDLRALWIARAPDRVICGVDLSGVQLRGLAHYANNEEYIKQILEGDIHTHNMNILNKLIREFCESVSYPVFEISRSNAKTFIYGYLFGAGNAKVGSICLFPEHLHQRAGKYIKEGFVREVKGLDVFKAQVKEACKTGYMEALDGRLIALPSEHLALSIYLQSYEACLMKWAVYLTREDIRNRGLDAKLVAIVHDEAQFDVKESEANLVGQLMIQNMNKAGELLKSNIRIDGEMNIGKNWALSH
jgi:DNA polymerase I-like protein with 3'-5' exonuclease and polymerase domains